MTKTALITGNIGQNCFYLAELLLDKEYEIYGLIGVFLPRISSILLAIFQNLNRYLIGSQKSLSRRLWKS